MNDAPTTRQELIESKIDRERSDDITVGNNLGGIRFKSMLEVMEFGKLMATAGPMIPLHLRERPGACVAVCLQAVEWDMSPFAVANKSYFANDRIAFESQLIHAIIEARAPLKGRLQCDYEGEGADMRCIVTGWLKGEDKPCVYRSERLADRQPKVNDKGNYPGSPLWRSKPRLQLWYDASRDWARQFCPDVIMGIYAPDEIEETAATKQIEPPQTSFVERIKSAAEIAKDGFNADKIAQTIDNEALTEEQLLERMTMLLRLSSIDLSSHRAERRKGYDDAGLLMQMTPDNFERLDKAAVEAVYGKKKRSRKAITVEDTSPPSSLGDGEGAGADVGSSSSAPADLPTEYEPQEPFIDNIAIAREKGAAAFRKGHKIVPLEIRNNVEWFEAFKRGWSEEQARSQGGK